ncbi:MAG: diguanylate cyclase [Oligoflexia bacterium]|nr:diguanylate cyclase [Oligoflexia bacterium]
MDSTPKPPAPPQAAKIAVRAQRPALAASYSDLFDRLPDPGFLLDPETFAVIDVNPATELKLGIPTEKAIGCQLSDSILDSEREEFAKALRMTKRRYYQRKFNVTWVPLTGQVLYLEAMACVLDLAEGRQALQLICRDITAEREARKKEERYLQELVALNAKLEELSTFDEMTGLANYRYFKRELSLEHERARRYGQPYSIVFCDVDHFKHYNDRNGHPAGDELLRMLGTLIKNECRNLDLPARYGGEEFAILCRSTPALGAQVLAERLRARVAKHDFQFAAQQPLGRVSISIGIGEFKNNGSSAEEVLKAADVALYASKRDGRNRVTLADK